MRYRSTIAATFVVLVLVVRAAAAQSTSADHNAGALASDGSPQPAKVVDGRYFDARVGPTYRICNGGR